MDFGEGSELSQSRGRVLHQQSSWALLPAFRASPDVPGRAPGSDLSAGLALNNSRHRQMWSGLRGAVFGNRAPKAQQTPWKWLV